MFSRCKAEALASACARSRLLGVAAVVAGGLTLFSSVAAGQSTAQAVVENARQSSPGNCAGLSELAMRDTKINSTDVIRGGSFTPPGATAPLTGLPDFCRVTGTVFPTTNFEVWLPLASAWNGKFAASGSGSMGGYVNYSQLPQVQNGMAFNLRKGYATAATDQGHVTGTTAWLLDPGRLVDWGFRANHEVAVRAKTLIGAFYGAAPKYSYFEGCSGGGQQAMMQAQRYPGDYDGIVAGAPAHDWSALMVSELWNGQATLNAAETKISPSKLPAINNAVLAVCDRDDGVADGLVSNPPACKFDPQVLLCGGAESDSCLTQPQVDALKKIYAGPRNPRTGELIYPPLSKGGELNWGPQVGASIPAGSTVTWFRWGIFENADWDWKVFDYDTDWEKTRAKLSYINDANDPDLRPFRDRGAKLIMWHGWGDWLIAAEGSVKYYEQLVDVVEQASGSSRDDAFQNTQEFARLFMIPGVGHCSGGPGTDTFDPLAALERWVENGEAPERLIASKVTSGSVTKTRPLCPYPQVAVYKGIGSVNNAASFSCRMPN